MNSESERAEVIELISAIESDATELMEAGDDDPTISAKIAKTRVSLAATLEKAGLVQRILALNGCLAPNKSAELQARIRDAECRIAPFELSFLTPPHHG